MSNIIQWIIIFADKLGYLGIFISVALEYACFPISSEILLPLIGILVYNGKLKYLFAIITSILAGIFGSTLCYIIGVFF